jgi:hypothetical protein
MCCVKGDEAFRKAKETPYSAKLKTARAFTSDTIVVNDRLNRATHDRRNGAIKKAQKRFQTAFSN